MLVSARSSFEYVSDGNQRYGITIPVPLNCGIAFSQGDTFRLTIPRKLAQVGKLIRFAEIEGNPAFDPLWSRVERQR